MLTATRIHCLRNILCSLFLLISIITQAQTPGLIVRPAGGPYSSVLDKNQDGFTSPTSSGFVTTDVGVGYSEIPYKIVPPFKLEPTSDLMRGPNTLFSDLVRISNDESGMYIYNDGTNMLFRLRLGSIVSGSKGYSILIDADGLFGASGPYADPNYKPATTGINGNPGFELEVVLETNFRVAIYDVDGKDDAGTTAYKTYSIDNNSQISLAYSTVSGNPDYLYDFYVPIADLKYAGGTKSVTATTPIRVSATTVMSPQASIGGPKSDIYGYDGTDYMKAWETIINGQPSFTPNDVLSSGSGVSSSLCTAAPTLNSPISSGATTFNGTWTNSDATRPSTATITLYKDNVAVGSTTATSGIPWTITITSANAAAVNNVFYTKAQANGESACFLSNSVKVSSCTNQTPTTELTITCSSTRGIAGTRPSGATVRMYSVTTSGITLYATDNNGTDRITYPTATTWEFQGPNVKSSDPCGGGTEDITSGSYAFTAQLTGQCESDYVRTCVSGNGSATIPQTADPTITPTVIYTGTTSFSGTATAGALIRLFINGQLSTTATTTSGSYTFSSLILNTGDIISISAQATGNCVSNRVTRTVTCFTSSPIINTDASGNLIAGASVITGRSSEPTGTTIKLYDGSNTLKGTTTVASDGTWSVAVSATSGTSYYATAQSSTCGVSQTSVSATALAATIVCPTITGSYDETSTKITGTLPSAFSGKVRLYLDGVKIDSVTLSSATAWSFTPTVNTLYPGGVLSVTTQATSAAEKTDCSASVTISCATPSVPSVTPATIAVSSSNGKVVFTITNSQSNVLYTLEDLNGVDKGTSVFGNNGSKTLTSNAFLTPGTYNLRISTLKLSGTNCGTSSTNVTITVGDNDGDNIADVVDIDDDDDGILDTNETATYDATGDSDGDGVLNYKDTSPGTGMPSADTNSDGIVDAYDTDKDGIIDQFDLDADNDGITDIIENGGTDSDNDGKVDGATDTDLDGLRNNADATPSGSATGSIGLSLKDFDGDGIYNFKDLDSDGDGILDSRESGFGYDTNANGVISDDAGYADTSPKDGWSDVVDALTGSLNLRNTDGGIQPNYLDIDSDNDGIVDNIEGQSTSGYLAPLGTDSDKDGIDDRYDNNTASFGGNANNGIIPVNTDGDSLSDYRDLDSDNDGFPDAFEGHDTNGDNLPNANTATKNGVGGTADVDGDGLLDGYDNNTSAVNPTNGTTALSYPNIDKSSTQERDWREVADNDGDLIVDLTDIDDDNDGIADTFESGGIDPLADADGDGILNYLDKDLVVSSVTFTDVNGDGINDVFDADRDGIINSFDLDSDNDGVPDLVEAGGVDTNGDGRADYTGTFASNDSDNDGLINLYDATAIANLDTDGDGIKNFLDLDSDNDGIPDVVEVGGVDVNGDGRLDSFSDSDGDGFDSRVDGDANNDGTAENTAKALLVTGADGNGDGKPDNYPQGIANTDGGGLPNPYDLDSDNDGLPDIIEAGGSDSDNNGKVDVFADTDKDGFADARDGDVGNDGTSENLSNVLIPTGSDANNDGKADSYSKANADGGSLPNPYDLDSDDDGVPDLIEQGGLDSNGDGMIDTNSDADGNGWQNSYDPTQGGLNLKTLDANGAASGGSVFDFDGDGIANYLDLDSDNDGIPDIIEQGGSDSNNDGKLDATVDADNDGFIDSVDPLNNKTGAVLGTAIITTGNTLNTYNIPSSYSAGDNFDLAGLINMQDLDADGDGILDAREAALSDSNNDGIADGTLGIDGWSDAIDGLASLNLPNTDGTGKFNFLDIDSDDDGITDNVEGQSTSGYLSLSGNDDDLDGIDNAYDNNDALYGGSANNGITPNNNDGTDNPDYLDTDTDNDSDLDIVEGNDFNGNGKADDTVTLSGADTDGDGLDNIFESDRNNGPIVTIIGFSSGTGGKSPAQRTPTSATERDWRNASFSLTSNLALPVHFVSISAAKQSNGVQVVWTVTNEVNVKSYEIEKSTNGSRYSKIGEVAFAASTNAINKYKFFDASIISSTVYYRIRQVDQDGQSMYSNVVFVNANESGSKLTVNPNPVNSGASIVLGVKSNQKAMLVVCDMQGKILHKSNVELQKGQNVIPADSFTQLSSGTYILWTEADGGLLQTRFIKH